MMGTRQDSHGLLVQLQCLSNCPDGANHDERSYRPRRLDENPEHGIEADAVTDAKLEMCKGDFAEHPDCYSVPRGTHHREYQAGVFHPVSQPSRSKLAV